MIINGKEPRGEDEAVTVQGQILEEQETLTTTVARGGRGTNGKNV